MLVSIQDPVMKQRAIIIIIIIINIPMPFKRLQHKQKLSLGNNHKLLMMSTYAQTIRVILT